MIESGLLILWALLRTVLLIGLIGLFVVGFTIWLVSILIGE